MNIIASSQTSSTPEITFEPEQVDKTVMFFGRLKTIYGNRFDQQWKTKDQIKMARREWIGEIGSRSIEELELALKNLKKKLSKNDQLYRWPDIAAILELSKVKEFAHQSHRPLVAALPEPREYISRRKLNGQSKMKGLLNLVGSNKYQRESA